VGVRVGATVGATVGTCVGAGVGEFVGAGVAASLYFIITHSSNSNLIGIPLFLVLGEKKEGP
jgi:hypothetical protein